MTQRNRLKHGFNQPGGKEERELYSKDSLLAFHGLSAEHWEHIRTTNPIESTFATVRHRTTRSRNCLPRATFLGLAFKLMEEAEKSRRKIRGADKLAVLLEACRSRMDYQCRTIRWSSKNSPPEAAILQAGHTPVLTLARGTVRVAVLIIGPGINACPRMKYEVVSGCVVGRRHTNASPLSG